MHLRPEESTGMNWERIIIGIIFFTLLGPITMMLWNDKDETGRLIIVGLLLVLMGATEPKK